MLTAKNVADRLKLSPSTAREWASRYRNFIPRKKRGRFFEYPESAIPVFEKIKTLHGRGLFTDQVKDDLQSTFGEFEEGKIEEPKDGETSIVVRQEFQETIAFFTKIISKYDELISVQREELTLLKKIVLKKEVVKKATKRKKKPVTVKKSRGVGRIIKTIFSEPFK